MDAQPSKHSKRYRLALIVMCAALVIAGAAYAGYLFGMNHAQQLQKNPSSQSGMSTDTIDFSELESELTDVEYSALQAQNGEKDVVNILLVGQDASSPTSPRSDTIMLCHFDKKNKTVTMISFLRDLYIEIPGHGKNRINASYSLGGIELLKETLNHNFGVEVDGSVQVDFSRFEDIIDTLGGVTMELTGDEAWFINEHLGGNTVSAGTQVLNGKQALLYARDRFDFDGDFSRTNRQRKLLNKLIETYKSKKLTEMIRIVREILPLVTTDISKADMTAYAISLFPMLTSAEIHTQAIPIADSFYGANIDGMSVLVPDMEKNIQAVKDALS